MPSPKWKLVVDVGEPEPVNTVASSQTTSTAGYTQTAVELADAVSVSEKGGAHGKDRRIDEVVSLLGEYMPADPSSPLAPYTNGFMSLRLLMLRSSRSPEEEDQVRTMMDSYSSYSQGGRPRGEIGVMLARDFMFLQQQKNQQPPAGFFSAGQGTVNNSNQPPALPGFPIFDAHNSPTLAPIGMVDSMSVIST